MARKPSNRSRIEQLTDTWEPIIKAAFFEAVTDIVSRAELKRIVERLERGDIAGAIDAVHLDPAAFRTLDLAIAQTFNAGGASEIGALPTLRDPQGSRFVVRWDARNDRAEAWLRQHSSTLITRITDDQAMAIRRALEQGMIEGRNPRATALNIIGRVSRVTGKREGGIVGLTGQQSTFVASARSELSSGDPTALRNYLNRGRRDKRFDRTILKAIEAETAVPADLVNRIVGRYADGLLALRGETIAHHETMQALGQSGIEAMQQAVDAGAVMADTITGTWHTARDKRVRDSHAAQDRMSVPFGRVFPNGQRFPHDDAAGFEESAGCRCWMEQRIDSTAGLIAEERRLAGL
jgi:hypothetical protein